MHGYAFSFSLGLPRNERGQQHVFHQGSVSLFYSFAPRLLADSELDDRSHAYPKFFSKEFEETFGF